MANKYDHIMAELGGVYRHHRSGMDIANVSEEKLDEIQSRIGHFLPADYREFLQKYGDWRFSNVPFLVDDDSDMYGSVFVMYGASLDRDNIAEHYIPELEDDPQFPEEEYPGLRLVRELTPGKWLGWPKELLPIGCDGGGNQICLALSGLRPGAIFYWINSPWDGYDNVYLVADSFDELVVVT